MSNFSPLVSIIIPVYNGSNFLAEAIESALAQTYSNIEILVINDGSNDDETRSVALTFGEKIRYFEKENGGVATALNLGIEKMKGTYFSWLSHDDLYLPEKIATQIEYLERLEDKNIILYSDYCYIDENSIITYAPPSIHVAPSSFRTYFIMGGLIGGCTLLVPKLCFTECGVFLEHLKATQDYDLWFRFSNKFNFVHIAKVLVKSRQHSGQDTVKLKKTVLDEGNSILIYFLKTVTKREIASSYEKPVPVYYLDFAIKNFRYGYIMAARYSFFLAISNLSGLRTSSFVEYIKKLRRAFVLFYKLERY